MITPLRSAARLLRRNENVHVIDDWNKGGQAMNFPLSSAASERSCLCYTRKVLLGWEFLTSPENRDNEFPLLFLLWLILCTACFLSRTSMHYQYFI